MRWLLSMALALAVATPSLAADLNLTPRKRIVHVRHHHHVRVVRDYDGTPITIRRRADGTADARVAWRASPSRYLNGELVASWIGR
ncbi:hypothetical protein [Rhodoplanes sp. Z2-YC6860]|uniref:hypothetical protein n=1 Tax=Rhodoplanes sp. Z2-YC6860 TaxID=674703 RepID=UPI00082DF93B|nr:hypothetical protein [Rhodoplanes sp. Z2-YC6860]